VFGALSDKDVRGIVEPLRDVVSAWHLTGLAQESPRGLSPTATLDLVQSARSGASIGSLNEDVGAALDAAFADAQPADRIIAFGSFFIAAAAMRFAATRGFDSA
jgi:dihydrofolate synthase/folylpolyglutamate synthase